VIRPRGDILQARLRHFDLAEAFNCTDDEFCDKFGIDKHELIQNKRNRHRQNDDEKDYLWKYVHAV